MLRLFFLFLLLISQSHGNRVEISELNSAGINREINGFITCHEGNPLKGLIVSAYSEDDLFPGIPSSTAISDKDGLFTFNSDHSGSYILEIEGHSGKGRIYVNPGSSVEPLFINYPVEEKIVFIHNNDLHFDMNNLSGFSSEVEKIRSKYGDTFLVNSGDIFVRHPFRWIVNGKLMPDVRWYFERASYMVTTMNQLGYDLLTLGNHELAYIESYTRDALELADFPLLAANVKTDTEFLPKLNPYVFLHTKTNRKIAVLGLTVNNAGRDGVEMLDIEETVQKYLPLKDSADIFLALTHIGLRNDRNLAENYPEFDLIIGGHSHNLLEEAIIVNGVLIAQAGGSPHIVSDQHPVFLGKTIITLENGKIKKKEGKVYSLPAVVDKILQH